MRSTDCTPRATPQQTAGAEKLQGIRHLIAVGSGQGGVGQGQRQVDAWIKAPARVSC